MRSQALLGVTFGQIGSGRLRQSGSAAGSAIAYLSSFVLSSTSRGGFGSVDALPYLGPRLPVLAAGDEMVDRSFRWSDCGRSVFRGPARFAWVPRSLLELAARVGRIVDVWAWSERVSEEAVSGGSSAAGPSARSRWYERRASLRAIVSDARLCDRPRSLSAW